MSELVVSAEKGSKKAMLALFESNKEEVYALTLALLNDPQKAGEITAEVIASSFNQITVKNIKTDIGFTRFLKAEVAKKAAEIIFKGNLKSFRVTKANSDKVEEITEEEFEGDISNCSKVLDTALAALSAEQRFVYILKTLGNLSFAHIGYIIVQREAAAKYFYDSAETQLFMEMDNDGINKNNIKSLLAKMFFGKMLPDRYSEGCYKAIKKRSKFQMPSKRAMIAIIVAVCMALVGIFSFIFVRSVYKKEAAENGGLHTPTQLDANKTYYADITIKDYGTIVIKLDNKSAPITAANFVELADRGFYDGLTFHRIIEGFMMQGGDPDGNGTGGPGYTIKGEFTANGVNNTLTNIRGAVAMARSSNDYDSAGSQFFIVHQDSEHLDGDYAVFGKVIQGMDIVDLICKSAVPSDSNGTIPAASQPIIESIKIRTEGNANTTAGDGNNSSSSKEEYTGYVPPKVDPTKTYYADINIKNYGKITIKLDQAAAPMTVANFVDLANEGFYDGLTFHRIIEDFMMQGGDPNHDGTGGPENNIFGEFSSNGFNNPLTHTRGAVSMARAGDPNSAGSQFFIVHQDSRYLDGNYAVFGYVTEGMTVVDAVCAAAEPVDGNGTIPYTKQPKIESIKIRTK